MFYNFAALFAAIAEAVPQREAIVFRDRRLSYADLLSRTNRLANLLLDHGITIHQERAELPCWVSGQDHVALYLHNGNEYIEGMIGAAAARAASFNVNYRYVEAELAYLLNDASTSAIIYHARFAPILASVLPSLTKEPKLLLQVADDSGHSLLPGALDYETALAASRSTAPDTSPHPDDLYIVYTGGTTGMPKGTLWTQANIIQSALAAFMPEGIFDLTSMDEAVAKIIAAPAHVLMPLPPLMHAAAQWMAMSAFLTGSKIAFPNIVDRLDPPSVWEIIDREAVQFINLVGNAFATPMFDAFEQGAFDGRSLQFVGVGGAVTSASVKNRILRLLPQAVVGDVAGSSETGSQLSNVSSSAAPATSGTFTPAFGSCVVDESKSRILSPGDPDTGWLARHSLIPMGYLGDQAKTERTFINIAGLQMVLPGDRARHLSDGTIELLGRDSVTINSGGEKIFAEEVEEALANHPAVKDVVVVGRPHDRWGQEVVAIIELRAETQITDRELSDYASEKLARYKLPKAFIRIDNMLRSPSGKADYEWARNLAIHAISA